MKVLELFSGTGHISNMFRAEGNKAWKVDWSKDLDANLHIDISTLTKEKILELCDGKPDVIWASPDCTTFSIAATAKGGGLKHREAGTYAPKTDYAKFCDDIDQHVIDLIAEVKPKYWFIENPRGLMRKMPWMESIADKLPGGGTLHRNLLSVWWQNNEAHRYLDKSPRHTIQTSLQERRPMSHPSPTWKHHWCSRWRALARYQSTRYVLTTNYARHYA